MSFFSRIYQKILSPYHYLWAFFSALFLGLPGKSKKIKIIGITGTKGKSTVVEFTERILEEAGYRVASFSSIKIKIGEVNKKNLFKMTMPGRWHIQKFLKDAIKSKCDYAILEVTSEGILQHRHKFINFEVVVFTNLSPEHIERHGSFEAYREAKLKLFKNNCNIHILNLDDENIDYFLRFEAKKRYGFKIISNLKSQIGPPYKELQSRTKSQFKTQNIKIIDARIDKLEKEYSSFIINDSKFEINLLGKFNVYNALAAICIGISQRISLDIIRKGIEKVKKVSGRMEVVIEQPFKVIVDYAHTPQSLAEVYKVLRNPKFQKPNSKLICVLGAAGGGRDKWKRPKLGEVASRFCDKIIITNEDPYDEDPMNIINEVAITTKNKGKEIEKILDRRVAINSALKLAERNDIIIITGKGSEPWMCVAGGKKIPWDDREVAKQELEKVK